MHITNLIHQIIKKNILPSHLSWKTISLCHINADDFRNNRTNVRVAAAISYETSAILDMERQPLTERNEKREFVSHLPGQFRTKLPNEERITHENRKNYQRYIFHCHPSPERARKYDDAENH